MSTNFIRCWRGRELCPQRKSARRPQLLPSTEYRREIPRFFRNAAVCLGIRNRSALAFLLFWFCFCGFCFGVFYFAVAGGEPRAHFCRVVIERPHSAAVGDFSLLVDDVEPFRPRSISVIRGILHVIHAER